MLPIRKTKKICKTIKALLKHISELESDIEEFELVARHKQKPIEFSPMLKDDSIQMSPNEASVISQRYRQGQITLNAKLDQCTTWRLKMCGISLAAQFGICEVTKQNKIGSIYGLYSQGYGPNRNLTGYEFQNNTWIKLTYDPETALLQFYNEETKKNCTMQIPQKEEDCEYYPYVFLYKATVYLTYEPDPEEEMYEMYEDYCKRGQQENNQEKQQKP